MLLYPQKCSAAINLSRSERGFITPLVLMFSLIFSIGVASLLSYAQHTNHQIAIERQKLKSFYIAQAATEKALAQVKQLYSNGGPLNQQAFQDYVNNMKTDLPNVSGAYFSYSDSDMTLGAQTSKKLNSGNYAGLNGLTQTVTVEVTSEDAHYADSTPVTLKQQIEVQLIPVFQFGVFYQNDLEILPGPTMTFTGPVHTNKDLYLGVRAGGALNFNSTITSFGNVYHGRKDNPNDLMPGDVYIQDADDHAQNMLQNGVWLDSTQNNWETESQNRWSGNIKSVVHGTSPLTVPLPTGSNQHALIERRSASDSTAVKQQKLDYKAQIRFIADTTAGGMSVYDKNNTKLGAYTYFNYCKKNSTIVNPNSNGTCNSGYSLVQPVFTGSFFNGRENKTIKSTDIDVSLLNNSPRFKSIADAASTKGVIIYHSDYRNNNSTTNQDAIRLMNGSQLYQGNNYGMTVISENPIYVKGDYNSSSNSSIKKPAGLVGDSVNVLSNNWNDSNSTKDLSNRTANATTVKAAVITGNTETVVGNYNGGFENSLRFLENWGNVNFTYSGSTIVLYNSQKTTGNWNTAGYYSPPKRVWSFDTDLSNANYTIPGFPSVYQVIRSRWELS